MYDINFLVFVDDKDNSYKYQSFVVPYIFFALQTNENSHVEVIIPKKDEFCKKYKRDLELLKEINDNYILREPTFTINKHILNTYRFFETPKVKAKYTYITDIDIMFMEEVLPSYLCTWPTDLVYHNIVRSNTCRLTGVHMVLSEKYYTNKFISYQKKLYNENVAENDEVILYKMCKEIHGLPKPNFSYRPIFGIHFSPNRSCYNEFDSNTDSMVLKTTSK